MNIQINYIIPGVIPVVIDEGCSKQVDLVMMVDSSDAMRDSWGRVIQFVASFLEYYSISANETRVAFVVFASEGQIVFDFNAFTSKDQLMSRILQLSFVGGLRNTQDGLRKMRDVFRFSSGDRVGVPDVVILITNGQHSPGTRDPSAESRRAYDEHISILVVGIGEVDVGEIRDMSYVPKEKDRTYFLVDDIADINSIMYRVQVMSCEYAESRCRIGMSFYFSYTRLQ